MSRIVKDKDGYYMELEVAFENDGEYVVAYCPALELSAYAKSEAGAIKSFEKVLRIFIDDTTKKGTLERVLLGLGWKLQQKPSFKYQPPQLKSKDRRAIRNWSVRVERRIPANVIAA